MNVQYSASEKGRVLAALQLACDRAILEQDDHRKKITDLPKPTPEMVAAVLDAIIQTDPNRLIEFFAGYYYPSSWADREMFGVRRSSEDDPYNVSRRYRLQISDDDIGQKVHELNERVEHRDRIALLARFNELIGFRLDDAEKLMGKHNRIVERLNFLFAIIFRFKCFEWLGAQARELGRVEDERFFSNLAGGMRFFLESMPELTAEPRTTGSDRTPRQ